MGNCRGQEECKVRDPGPRHAEDAQEARDEGGQEGDVRQGREGEGEAGEDRSQGVPREGAEGRVLSAWNVRAQMPRRGSGSWQSPIVDPSPLIALPSLLPFRLHWGK